MLGLENVGHLLVPKVRREYAAAQRRSRMAADPDPSSVSRDQLDKLQTVWADCISDVPYYTRLAQTGVAPKYIRDFDDFRSIPILTRQILQEESTSFIRRSKRPDGFVFTAGSTGTPLQLGVTAKERALMRIVKVAEWHALGYRSDSRLFLIWGQSHALGLAWSNRLQQVRRVLADWILGYKRVNAYRLSRDTCLRYAQQLIRFRPVGIIGYASALDLFARYTLEYRKQYHALGIRFVLATSEPPPRPDTFAMLEDLFACQVVQEYGGSDFGQVAFKCGSKPFRVFSDLNYVECDTESNTEPGPTSLLISTLYDRYVPLVRYRVKDAVHQHVIMPHGHIASFAGVAGRLNDVVRLADGDSIHSLAILHCVHQEPSVYNLQMELTDDGVTLHVVTAIPDTSALEVRIRTRLAQVHPLLALARFNYVEDLSTTRAGKRRWFVDRRTS